MIERLLIRALGLDAGSVVENWAFRFGSEWPLLLLALGIVAALAAALVLYFREKALSRAGRITLATVRTLAVGLVLAMLFHPMIHVRIRQTLRPTVLLLVDDSESMTIRDTRKDLGALADAAIATGKLPYDGPELIRAVLGARRAMDDAGAALAANKLDAARTAQAEVKKALGAVRTEAQRRSPAVGATVLSALTDLENRQAKLASGQDTATPDVIALAAQQQALGSELVQWKEQAVNSGLTLPDNLSTQLALVARRDLVGKSLQSTARPFLEQLGRQANVRCFRFGETLEEMPAPWVSPNTSAGNIGLKATHLGTALTEVLGRSEGQPVALAAVITDGASNGGTDPLDGARLLRQRGIPLMTVGVGLPRPDDAILRSMVVPDVVFTTDLVTVRVQCQANGYERRTAALVARLDGVEAGRKTITYTGKTQFEEIAFAAGRKGGSPQLEVELVPLPGEATTANNTLRQSLRVLDDKIKVLYIEGSPRWEYRYIRAVLKRDPRIDVQFINTEGDKDLARATREHLGRFPEQAEQVLKYDLIILGDVRANTFTPTQFGLMEQLVRERGGSLIMLAGYKHTPGEYLDTPIAAMLPVRFEQEKWTEIGPDVYPALTPEGQQSSIMALERLESRNQALWANVKPLYRVPPVLGAKRGAVVLAELSDRVQQARSIPLIAWQRYGTGKVMFIGADQLWRLRARTGDKYHLKFWGQAVQFLTLSRLLGENKMVRVETSRERYASGETVELHASVLDESYEPLGATTYQVYVTPADGGDAVPVTLKAMPNNVGLYTGALTPRAPGRYRLTAAPGGDAAGGRGAERANSAEFVVEDRSIEQIETGMQQSTLAQMAHLTGGDALTLRELPLLADRLPERTQQVTFTRDLDLWDNWLTAVLFIGLVAGEWAWRRNRSLA